MWISKMIWSVLLAMSVCVWMSVVAQSGKDVDGLLKELFTVNKYNKNVRPLLNQSKTVHVAVQLALTAVIGLDEQDERLKTTGVLVMEWTDEYLKWDSSHKKNITRLYIPQIDIWKPDVYFKNTFSSFSGLGYSHINVEVESNGHVTWNPYHVLETTCTIDITNFPFDEQECAITVTTWSYRIHEVEINRHGNGLEMKYFFDNTAWHLANIYIRDGNSDKKAMTYILVLKRKAAFYITNVLLPIVLLSILNCFAFCLPTSSGEKASYAMTTFLSLAVFLTIISTELPKNSVNTSWLAVYLAMMSSLSTFVVILCLIETRIASRDVYTNPINAFFIAFIKVTDCFTFRIFNSCANKSVTPIGNQLNASLTAESDATTEISWNDVVNAMDFVLFGLTALYTFLSTIVLSIVVINSGDY